MDKYKKTNLYKPFIYTLKITSMVSGEIFEVTYGKLNIVQMCIKSNYYQQLNVTHFII